MRFRWWLLGVAAALTVMAEPAAAQLVSHRALYTLSMGAARAGSGVNAIRGTMSLELQEVCEGWTLNQRMRFQVFDGEGEPIDTDISFSSWEARDGLHYRFTLRSLRNGEVSEELRGGARLAAHGKGGKAEFTKPEGQTIDLPPGTLFPTEHSLVLIRAAEAGERHVSRPVFDGATFDGAMDISAAIGSPHPPEPAGSTTIDKVVERPSWRMRLAIFKPGDRNAEPDYETSVWMLDNGVGRDFVFDYSDFSIKAQLTRLDALPKPQC
ncbi:MAG: cell envelope integrity EipB family protein [Rhodospirillales bacterium]|nr:cell envelope integrity EipB family protein [Rhodospirillales bacterium]